MNVLFVIPIFNDWVSFRRLVSAIDGALADQGCNIRILAVDDGSTEPDQGTAWETMPLRHVECVDVVRLECNLGHQKAIAIGLTEAAKIEGIDHVVVMDGDGEDDPAELPRLLETRAKGNAPMVLAHRSKRSEGRLFRFFYVLYKQMFRLMTGVNLAFGNYCVLSPQAVRCLTFMPNLWNSLPATCLRSKLPFSVVPTVRGKRYAGEPKMNFASLILHGLQAITVFSDTALVRLSLGSTLVAMWAALVVVLVRLIGFDWIVPGWASNMIGFVVLSLMTILFSLLNTSLLALQERSNMPMIPFVHAEVYVRIVERLR